MKVSNLLVFILIQRESLYVSAKKRFKKKAGFECSIIDSRVTETVQEKVNKCDRACRGRFNCYGFQYTPSTKRCLLLDYVPTRVQSDDAEILCGVTKKVSFKPYVIPDRASEVADIPEPPMKEALNYKTNCPHYSGSDILNWDEEDTWPNGIPQAGDAVTIPENTRIRVRKSIDGILGKVTIPASSVLIFADKANGIQMKAKGFDVQGSLLAGSETCPIDGSIEIELHGRRKDDSVTNPQKETYKGISVSGTLSLHGKLYQRSWVRLGKSSYAGHDHVLTQYEVDWVPGQQVVVVTSAIKDAREWHQNEVKTIDLVQPFKYNGKYRGSIVYFTSLLEYDHVANKNYQVEIGLLTRTIKIQGAEEDSVPTDPDPLTCTGKRRWGSDTAVQCANKELTGFGGHIIIHDGGVGYVEGVELYRMGQTNVLGRYPMHFHMLENNCQDCYFRHSSIHKSYYRCVSIHGTNGITVTENVGYDVAGYCYYLEDGVEEENTISYNLAAHIHYLSEVPVGQGQKTNVVVQTNKLTLPADVTASGFYITNVRNNIVGNAASGGWAGFAFPTLMRPIGLHKDVITNPSSRLALEIRGNTAHSSGWWWSHAGAFYFGGALYIEDNKLKYHAGREQGARGQRNPCNVDMCALNENWCNLDCSREDNAWNLVTDNKAFLVPGVGLQSWKGRMEVKRFEAHDVGLGLEALQSGFWIHNMLVVCRTGEKWRMPDGSLPTKVKANGFFWYDTAQEHLVTRSTFRNCGYRRDEHNQYEQSPTRGCEDSFENGCHEQSTVFGMLTHSDQFNPQVMQATEKITFEDCGRRFRNTVQSHSTVSGRTQNWFDVDGSVTGLNVPTLIGSGQVEAGLWWNVEDEALVDVQGPLVFIKKNEGIHRNLGFILLDWDENEHSKVGTSVCTNTMTQEQPCEPLGYIKHFGERFENDLGLPVTAASSITGLTGGFGWLLTFLVGAPKTLKIPRTEIYPDSPLVLGIPYPPGTQVTITALASPCRVLDGYTCSEEFHEVDSPDLVRSSQGNAYHMNSNGFLTVRIIMLPGRYVGSSTSDFEMPNIETEYDGWYALDRFAREDITLLRTGQTKTEITITADCNVKTNASKKAYCKGTPTTYRPTVCQNGFEQVSYDKCCDVNNPTSCVFA